MARLQGASPVSQRVLGMPKLKGPYRVAAELPVPDHCRCGGKAERRDVRWVEEGIAFILPAAHCLGHCKQDYVSGEALKAMREKKRELGIPSRVPSRTNPQGTP